MLSRGFSRPPLALGLDPSGESASRQIEVFRQMTGAERVAMALSMSEAAQELAVAGIRHRHPNWTAEQVRDALLVQLHGPLVAEEVRRSRLARV